MAIKLTDISPNLETTEQEKRTYALFLMTSAKSEINGSL